MLWRACAIDGPGGSGKSTIARKLAKDLGAEIISMDSFLLPPDKYRPSLVAKNYDLDRFSDEVIQPLLAALPIRYRIADSPKNAMRWVHVDAEKPLIIEGIYSFHLRFREAYDFSIFVAADKETLLRRGVGAEVGAGTWIDKWLPSEETYLEAQAPMAAATLVLNGAAPTPPTKHIMELIELKLTQPSS